MYVIQKGKTIIEMFQTQFFLFSLIFRSEDRHVVVGRDVVERKVMEKEEEG